MYNYFRWFPNGKIVFMAPTKPLVNQQVKACHSIVGIPQADTASFDSSVKPIERKKIWLNRRLFFCTPQIFQNDLQKNMVNSKPFVLIVFDEAHKAKGQYGKFFSYQIS